MKTVQGILFLVVLSLCWAGTAFGSFTYSNSGEDMFTITNDNNISTLETSIENWFSAEKGITRVLDLSQNGKIEYSNTSTTDGTMTVTYADDGYSGTWHTDSLTEFYFVKAAHNGAMYWVDGGAYDGTWNVGDLGYLTPNPNDSPDTLQYPQISHFSTYVDNNYTPPAPAPAAIFLVGLGVAGVKLIRRRKLL